MKLSLDGGPKLFKLCPSFSVLRTENVKQKADVILCGCVLLQHFVINHTVILCGLRLKQFYTANIPWQSRLQSSMCIILCSRLWCSSMFHNLKPKQHQMEGPVGLGGGDLITPVLTAALMLHHRRRMCQKTMLDWNLVAFRESPHYPNQRKYDPLPIWLQLRRFYQVWLPWMQRCICWGILISSQATSNSVINLQKQKQGFVLLGWQLRLWECEWCNSSNEPYQWFHFQF